MKLFLQHGVDVNEKGLQDNSTALHTATFYSRPYTAEILINAGADINARNNEGWTPLHDAASSGRNLFLIELLIANGADINAQLEKCKERELDAECYPVTGDTALHIAAIDYSYNAAKVLLCLGADLNIRNSRGLTPLQVALERKRDSIADLLLQFGAIAEPSLSPPKDQPEQKTSYPPYQSQEHVFEAIYKVVDKTINDLLVPAAEEHILDKQERDDFISKAQLMGAINENTPSVTIQEARTYDSLVQVKLFDELTDMVNKEMKAFATYMAFFDDGEDLVRLSREALSKRVTKEALQYLLEDNKKDYDSGEFYYLLNRFDLLCGIAKKSGKGSLHKVDTISISKSTLQGIRHHTRKVLLEALEKEHKDFIQLREDQKI